MRKKKRKKTKKYNSINWKKNIKPNKINDSLIIKVKINNKKTNNNEIINGYIEDSNFSEYMIIIMLIVGTILII